MERGQEIEKLLNVLHRVRRAASYAAMNRVQPDAARFCAAQYNRLLARLSEIEPAAAPLFAPLPETTAPAVIRMAARELAAYFEDETRTRRRARRARHCGTEGMGFGWSPVSGFYWW